MSSCSAVIQSLSSRLTMSGTRSRRMNVFATSSIQKDKSSSIIDEAFPFGPLVITTFFVEQFKYVSASAAVWVRAANAIVSTQHSLTRFIGVLKYTYNQVSWQSQLPL